MGSSLSIAGMTFEVEITQQGRGGIYYYTEHGVKLPFEWDFSSIGITIYVPTHGAWNEFCRKNDAPWGIGRRQEILQRLGDEVRRRKAKSAQITIEDHWVQLSFKDGWIFRLLKAVLH